jgi:hypothetical protein
LVTKKRTLFQLLVRTACPANKTYVHYITINDIKKSEPKRVLHAEQERHCTEVSDLGQKEKHSKRKKNISEKNSQRIFTMCKNLVFVCPNLKSYQLFVV